MYTMGNTACGIHSCDRNFIGNRSLGNPPILQIDCQVARQCLDCLGVQVDWRACVSLNGQTRARVRAWYTKRQGAEAVVAAVPESGWTEEDEQMN